jgi:hypothetical protein
MSLTSKFTIEYPQAATDYSEEEPADVTLALRLKDEASKLMLLNGRNVEEATRFAL